MLGIERELVYTAPDAEEVITGAEAEALKNRLETEMVNLETSLKYEAPLKITSAMIMKWRL